MKKLLLAFMLFNTLCSDLVAKETKTEKYARYVKNTIKTGLAAIATPVNLVCTLFCTTLAFEYANHKHSCKQYYHYTNLLSEIKPIITTAFLSKIIAHIAFNSIEWKEKHKTKKQKSYWLLVKNAIKTACINCAITPIMYCLYDGSERLLITQNYDSNIALQTLPIGVVGSILAYKTYKSIKWTDKNETIFTHLSIHSGNLFTYLVMPVFILALT